MHSCCTACLYSPNFACTVRIFVDWNLLAKGKAQWKTEQFQWKAQISLALSVTHCQTARPPPFDLVGCKLLVNKMLKIDDNWVIDISINAGQKYYVIEYTFCTLSLEILLWGSILNLVIFCLVIFLLHTKSRLPQLLSDYLPRARVNSSLVFFTTYIGRLFIDKFIWLLHACCRKLYTSWNLECELGTKEA